MTSKRPKVVKQPIKPKKRVKPQKHAPVKVKAKATPVISKRPEFLNQPAKLKKQDLDLQKQLQVKAKESGVVLSKDSRLLDFIERSIEGAEQGMKETDEVGRAALKERLKFLREEYARLQT
ncbi:MAG: hypothetical protein ACR2HX_06180 [Pyrinomonadaceae bacterium]